MTKAIALGLAVLLGTATAGMAAESTTTSPGTSSSTSSSTSTTSYSPNMSESQVRQYLEQKGYTGISDLKKGSKDEWTGKATENGKQVKFQIDQTGNVEKQPSSE